MISRFLVVSAVAAGVAALLGGLVLVRIGAFSRHSRGLPHILEYREDGHVVASWRDDGSDFISKPPCFSEAYLRARGAWPLLPVGVIAGVRGGEGIDNEWHDDLIGEISRSGQDPTVFTGQVLPGSTLGTTWLDRYIVARAPDGCYVWYAQPA